MPTTKPAENPLKCSFVFVCHKGRIEGSSLILAASLKRFAKCDYEMIAAVPRPESFWGTLHPNTLQVFEEMGVRVEYFDNPQEKWELGQFHTNKIFAQQVHIETERMVFVDSDFICLKPFYGHELANGSFCVTPAYWSHIDNWEEVYEVAGLQMPTRKIKALNSDDMLPMYFNSGIFAIDQKLRTDFFNAWLANFEKVDQSGVMHKNHYFREEVSMSLALNMLDIPITLLDESYNYWVKKEPLDTENLPKFLHHSWHDPPLYHQPFLNKLIASFGEEYPLIRPVVKQMFYKHYLRPPILRELSRLVFRCKPLLKPIFGKYTDLIVRA